MKRKGLLITVIAVVAVVLGFVAWRLLSSSDSIKTEPSHTSESRMIRILGAGDFIPHDSVNKNAQQPDGTYSYASMMEQFKPLFSQADIRFCSDPILHGGQQFGITGYPLFNSPTELIGDMAGLGCNVIGAASNHSYDKNQAAIDATVATWRATPGVLAMAGQNTSAQERDTVQYFTIKGVKFAFLSYTTYLNSGSAPNDYGATVYSPQLAAQQTQAAKDNGADIIIASVRWGTEYSPEVNPQQQEIAQSLADQGVTVIFGHGPHVLQPVQRITGANGNETIVWYSLGNFLNTQIEAEALFNALAVLEIDPQTKKVVHAAHLPIYMHYQWTAAQKAAEDLMQRHSLEVVPLDAATPDMLKANQLTTTIEQQRARIYSTLNKLTSIPSVNVNKLWSN